MPGPGDPGSFTRPRWRGASSGVHAGSAIYLVAHAGRVPVAFALDLCSVPGLGSPGSVTAPLWRAAVNSTSWSFACPKTTAQSDTSDALVPNNVSLKVDADVSRHLESEGGDWIGELFEHLLNRFSQVRADLVEPLDDKRLVDRVKAGEKF